LDKIEIDNLEKVLEPIFVYFQQDQQNNETFGEFCHRVNFPALQAFSATYTPKMTETTTTESKPKRVP
jgi:sulfite reductase (ferredoxin)